MRFAAGVEDSSELVKHTVAIRCGIGKASGKSFGDYSGLRSLQLGGKLRSGCNNCNLIGIWLQFSWTIATGSHKI